MTESDLKVGVNVEFRGHKGQVIERSEKILTIYCSPKSRVPYRIGTAISRFLKEGNLL